MHLSWDDPHFHHVRTEKQLPFNRSIRLLLFSEITCYICRTCPWGYWPDNTVGDCKPCHDQCGNCVGPSTLDCTSCKQYKVYLDESNEENPIVSTTGAAILVKCNLR